MAALFFTRRSYAVAAVMGAVALAGCTHDTHDLFPPLVPAPAVHAPVAAAVPDTPAATTQTASLRQSYEALRLALNAREQSIADSQETLRSERQGFNTMSTEYDNRLMDGIDSKTPEMQAKHALLERRLAVLVSSRAQLQTVADGVAQDDQQVAALRQAVLAEADSPRAGAEQDDLDFLKAQTAILSDQEDRQKTAVGSALHYWQPIVEKDERRVQARALLPSSSATSPTPGGVSAADTMPPLAKPPARVAQEPQVMVVRFDQPNVDYTPAVKTAISRVEGKSSAQSFDLVAVTSVDDDESAHLRALDIRQIIASTGVPLDHIRLYAETNPAIGPSEVRIYQH